MFVLIVVVLAGLFLLLRDLLPYIAARRTGAIRTRGHSPKLVLRSEEPSRFNALCRNRIDGVTGGAMVIVVSPLLSFISLLAPVLILPVWAIMTARAKQ